jgi:hypothetical protein
MKKSEKISIPNLRCLAIIRKIAYSPAENKLFLMISKNKDKICPWPLFMHVRDKPERHTKSFLPLAILLPHTPHLKREAVDMTNEAEG